MYDANSQLYVYTVKETEDAAFTTKYDYSGNASGNTSAKITNTRKSYEINYAYVGDTPAGKATPMIVVMTNGNISMEAAPGEGSEGLTVPSMGLPKTMEGSFEAAFPEIVTFIDKTFRTQANKKGRAIAGLSMGGFHSCNISREYPTMFNYVGLFSAALGVTDPSISPIYQNADEKLNVQFNAKNRPALYYIAIGDTDFLYKANTEYRAKLDQLGYPYTYLETDGGHIWRNWRKYLADFAPKIFK